MAAKRSNASKDESARIRDFRDLIAWQVARVLVKGIYVITRAFPREELYGLTQQLRRAAISVPSNIAEGYGRGTRKDYYRFLQMARGSLYEVQTQLILAEDLGYVEPGSVEPLVGDLNRCSRLLHGLIKSLEREIGK
jgi:four helix bundle protein